MVHGSYYELYSLQPSVINTDKTFADSVKHVVEVNPNLRARIVPTVTPSESELDSYELQYIDEVGSGYFEYRRVFGLWSDQYGIKSFLYLHQ